MRGRAAAAALGLVCATHAFAQQGDSPFRYLRSTVAPAANAPVDDRRIGATAGGAADAAAGQREDTAGEAPSSDQNAGAASSSSELGAPAPATVLIDPGVPTPEAT